MGKETLKRWLVSILSVAMVVGSVPMPAYASELMYAQDEIVSDIQTDDIYDSSAVYIADEAEVTEELLEEESIEEVADEASSADENLGNNKGVNYEVEYQAELKGEKYGSLSGAISAAATGNGKLEAAETIKLLADFMESDVSIGSQNQYKNIILDLNGYKLGTEIKVCEGSKLEVIDSVSANKGSLTGYTVSENTYSSAPVITNSGILILSGGKLAGYSSQTFAAVVNKGQLEVKGDFAFENNENTGKQGEGGAIYNAGALNIHDDAKFVNCSATNGGAIYHTGVLSMAGAELVISGNVVFDKCHATTAGGAIAGYEGHLSVGGSTLFTECYVLNSAASVFGGAIAWFDCNDAGLAVEIKDKVQINNCYARETTNMAMKQGAFGGAVYVNNASLSMKDATKVSGCYTSSQVNSYGGGVYAINSTGNEKSVFLKDVTFDNCYVTGNIVGSGGALCADTDISLYVSGNSVFKACNAKIVPIMNPSALGGAISLFDSKAVVSDTTEFSNCKAEIVAGGNKAENNPLIHEETNWLGANGGAIFTYDSKLTVTGAAFDGCEANHTYANLSSAQGGAIACDGDSVLCINGNSPSNKVTIRNCKTSAYGKSFGGAIAYKYMSENKAPDENCFTTNNLEISDCSVICKGSENNPTANGGSIAIDSNDLWIVSANIMNTAIRNSAAEAEGKKRASGGAIFVNGDMQISNSYISGSYAKTLNGDALGGAIASLYGNNLVISDSTIDSCYIINNGSSCGELCGGAIYTNANNTILNTEIKNCYVKDNSKSEIFFVAGGALYAGNVEGCEIVAGTSINNVTFVDCYVSGNLIGYGGALYADKNTKVCVSGASKFNECLVEVASSKQASAFGGAISALEADLIVGDTTAFTKCKVDINPNMTYTNQQKVRNKELLNLNATGGAIGVMHSSVNINDEVHFDSCCARNNSTEEGSYANAGAIACLGNSKLNITGTSAAEKVVIENCTSEAYENALSGAIYTYGEAFELKKSIIADCHVKSDVGTAMGGAIVSYAAENKVIDSSIKNCYASVNSDERINAVCGGAIALCNLEGKLELLGNSEITGAKLIGESLVYPVGMLGSAVYSLGAFTMSDNAKINDCVAELSNAEAAGSEICGTVYVMQENSKSGKAGVLISGNAVISNNKITNNTISGNVFGAGVYINNTPIQISGSARIYDNMIGKNQSNLGLQANNGNVVSINIAPDYDGKLGVSICFNKDIKVSNNRLYFTNPTANLVNTKVFSDYDNLELNYDKALKKMYLSRHEDKWVLEERNGKLYGYCQDPNCKYYDKDGKCNTLVIEAVALDDRFYGGVEDYCYNKTSYNIPEGDAITLVLSCNIAATYVGTKSTSINAVNKSATPPTKPGTYRVYYSIPVEDFEKPFKIYDDFEITKYYKVTFDPGNGSFTGLSANECIVKEVNENERASRLANIPVSLSNNWIFKQWNLADGRKYSFNSIVSADVVLVAEYMQNYGDVKPEDLEEKLSGDIINAVDIWVAGVPSEVWYKGSKWTFDDIRVYDGVKRLIKGKDYTVSYKNNLNVATAFATNAKGKDIAPQVVIKGMGNYKQTYVKRFTIHPVDISNKDEKSICVYADDVVNKTYTGKVIKPIPTLKNSLGVALKNKKDFEVSYENIENKPIASPMHNGNYYIRVKGKGNYNGSILINYNIFEPGEISNARVTGFVKKFMWNALGKEASFEQENMIVTLGNVTLKENDDYILEYNRNNQVGKASVTIIGIGKYKGSKTLTYNITGTSIAKAAVIWKDGVKGFTYCGEAHTSDMYGDDFKLLIGNVEVNGMAEWKSYTNATKKATITVTGDGHYGFTGKKNVTFKIEPYDISMDSWKEMSIDVSEASFSKAGAKPIVYVGFGAVDLVEGRDYTLTYKNNKKVGIASVIIKGKGNFKGTVTKNYEIEPAKLLEECNVVTDEAEEGAVVSILPNVQLNTKKNGYKSIPSLFEKTSNNALKANKDYTIKYFNDENEEIVDLNMVAELGDIISVEITGIGNYTGVAYGSYEIVSSTLKNAKATTDLVEYTGNPIELIPYDGTNSYESNISISVKEGITKELKVDSDFEIVNYINNVKNGTASVTIIGKGKYAGMKTFKFKIAQRPIPKHINKELEN